MSASETDVCTNFLESVHIFKIKFYWKPYSIVFPVCVDIYVCAFMCECMHVCVFPRVGQKLTLCLTLSLQLLFLRQGLSMNLELTSWLDWLASEPQGSSFLPPSASIISVHCASFR